MTNRVLIIGGAGFVGSHLADAYLARGYTVRVLDNLTSQVHGSDARRPDYLSPDVEFIPGDIRDKEQLTAALRDVEIVSNQAAVVGVGQSMYEISRYVEANVLGTARLLDILANSRHSVRKLLVASSMSIYGEGTYACPNHGTIFPQLRGATQLEQQAWDVLCPHCGAATSPLPTSESRPPTPTSIYASTKRDQEEMSLMIGQAYNIPTVALRYFNIYGPRQSLSNPYTGVFAIFASRILSGQAPVVFEDGRQSRDFVHVSDIAQANILATENERADGQVYNVGTGVPTTVLQVARALAERLAPSIEPEVAVRYRVGDIRHCYADISKIRQDLGFTPGVSLDRGMETFVEQIRDQQATDRLETALQELESRRLIV